MCNVHESEIAQLLAKEIGLDVSSINSAAIRNVVSERMRVTGCFDLETYSRFLRLENSELALLAQRMLISESWFLREYNSLNILCEYFKERRASDKLKYLEILSSPCARGEEAVSILHIALKAGFRLEEVVVHGIDLSETAISLAESGVYTSGSFRNVPGEFVETYFHSVGKKYHLRPEYLSRIKYKKINLVEENEFFRNHAFDLVLCRNLFIYLDSVSRSKLVEQFQKVLKVDGVFVVGSAESSYQELEGLNRLTRLSHCIFNKAKSASEKKETKLVSCENIAIPQVLIPAANISTPAEAQVASSEVEESVDYLAKAKESADSGRYSEALDACLQSIEKDPFEAEAYYLLGLIATASNDRMRAAAYFKRTLYLDPSHEDAHLLLRNIGEQKIRTEGQL